MPDPVWLVNLRELICRIYEEWGGDCANLPFDGPARIAMVVANYKISGPPNFADENARQAFLDLLTELETQLNDPDNTLSGADTATLRQFITDLRNQIQS